MSRASNARTVRIIGGRHRGRRVRFPAVAAIRPTLDRVRETLFNWLAPRIDGAWCLDLFAGSGALGLEALSRGAAHVTFIERDPRIAAAIEAVLFDWSEQANARVVRAEARRFLVTGIGASGPPDKYDLVFLDPPFEGGLLAEAARALERGWLAPGAWIYVEHAVRAPLPALPIGWCELKSGRAGEVGYHLFARRGGDGGGGDLE